MKLSLKLALFSLGVLLTAVSALGNIPGGGSGTGPNVTLTDNGSTVTIANGIVTIVCTKSSATINQINYTYNNTGTTVTNQLLLNGKDGGEFYWETGGWGSGTFSESVVANNGNYCEIDLSSTSPTTNGVMDVHYSMLRGSPGFYVTAIWSHRVGDGAIGMGETRDNIYLNPEFTWNTIDANRNFQYNLGGAGGGGTGGAVPVFGAPQEVTLWTNGIAEGRYEDKYKYTADFGTERVWGWSSVNNPAAGFTGQNIGIWHILASAEYYNGGPMKPELMDAPMVNMLNGGHYYMGNDSEFGQNEVWTRAQGPYFIYCNNVTNTFTQPFQTAQALYNDALAQGAAEQSAWPYSWFTNASYTPASQRGAVTGQLVIADSGNPNASASNMWVGVVQQPATVNGVYDSQLWMKPYQFWVQTDSNGDFTIPNVSAGNNYTLWAFGPGINGTFLSQSQSGNYPSLLYTTPASQFGVNVAAGATNNLGAIVWTNSSRVGATVFEIGYPDRTARKFRHGEDWWIGDIGPSPTEPMPIWTKFLEYPFDFPNGPNYTVGQSRWTTDWNFIQPVVPDQGGNYDASTSTITFNLPAAPTNGATASFYLGICSDYSGPVIVSINGNNVANISGLSASPITSIPSTGYFPITFSSADSVGYSESDTSVREGINAAFSDERFTFPASQLRQGQNTITIGLRSRDYFADHFMYDYIRLELAGYVPPAPSSVTAYAGNNCSLVCWPVTPGATSYNLLRSTTQGSDYVSITNGVVGPVCGSGLNNAIYLDSTAVNGTTYYYEVQSVNPDGSSAASSSSSGATPSSSIAMGIPSAPLGLTVTSATHQSVALTWNASPGANFYTVYRSTLFNNLGGASNVLRTIVLDNNVTGTTYTDASPTDGSIYSYDVTATDAGGTSSNSIPAVAIPLPSPPASAPANIVVSGGSGQTNYFITWSPVSGAVGYIISRGTNSSVALNYGHYVMSVTETNWNDDGLKPSAQYFYMITAVNAAGVATSSILAGPPGSPATLGASAGNSEILLNWSATPGAASYTVLRGTSSGAETTTVATGVTSTTYVDSGLNNGTTYYYVVEAVGSSGTSVRSPQASATPSSTGVSGLVWTGATSSVWNTDTTNWLNGLSATTYADGDTVTFDDSAATGSVSITNIVSPGSVLFTNSALSYVLTSGGSGISGSTSLIKANAGALTLNGANTYTGGTYLEGGTLVLNNANAAGTGAITLNSGTLTLDAVISNPVDAMGTATLIPGSIDYFPCVLSGDGLLNVSITGGNTFSPEADMSGFTGTNELGASTGYYRFYGSLGSASAAFDLGTSSVTMLNRNGGVTIQLGSLAGGSGTTLTGASSANNPTIYSIGGNNNNATFSGKITDNDGTTAIVKAGSGAWTITGANTFSGGTTISGGTLLVNNTNGSGAGSGAVTVNAGGSLAGTGIISGAVTVNSNGALAPGNPLGALTISNNLTLAAGSTTLMQVQHSPLTNNLAKISGTLTEGGTLNVTNIGLSAFTAGDSFKLFSAGNYSGAFQNFILPPLTAGLVWNTNTLNLSGSLSVAAYLPPLIGRITVSGGNLNLTGSGGIPYWTYYVLASTNLPAAQWTPIETNQFDAGGNFVLTITNGVASSSPQTFLRLQLQ